MASENKTALRPFGMKDKLGYMFGDFGNDFTFILSSLFLMKFYTDVMGVSAGVVGIVMMAARIVDAFTDITMGQIVDRCKPTKDGKFRPWLKRMCGPVAIASFLIFQSGLAGMPYGFKVAWLAVTYILWGSIFYTSINIPYGSMASAVSPESKDRAELSTWRTIGSSLASLVIGVGTPMIAYVTVDGKTMLSGSRMTIIAGVFSVCAILCYLLCFKMVQERVQLTTKNEKLDFGKLLKSIATNREARHEYFVLEALETGVELKGTEVKSLRAGGVNLKDSWVDIENGELLVKGMHISPYDHGNLFNQDPMRVRRLLAHKSEIRRLHQQCKLQGYTLVPLSLYFKHGRVKMEVGLCKGKKLYDKRADAAQRDAKRSIDRAVKSNGKYY